MAAYDEDLAYIHDQGHSKIAAAAATSVLELLSPHASIVELGCGSGVTAARLTDAGHEVVGIDQSAALIALARRLASRADLRVGSFVSEPIPECDALLAIGEVFNYLFERATRTRAAKALRAYPHRGCDPTDCWSLTLARPASSAVVAPGPGRPDPTGPCLSRTTKKATSSRATSPASANVARVPGPTTYAMAYRSGGGVSIAGTRLGVPLCGTDESDGATRSSAGQRQKSANRSVSPPLGLRPPMQIMSRPSGPASNERMTAGATRSTSHGERSTTSSSSLARPDPATTM
jgi:hypothetical protein